MELTVNPKNSFKELEKKGIRKIILLAEKLLKGNKISIPKKVYFYNSFKEFVKKVIPEVKNYGFDEKISGEIIKCALNNGTYGTIDFKENSIIEMNFNPFNEGKYSSIDLLELIVHEALHLHLSKKIKKDINSMKFKFNKNSFIGNKRIIQIDEGYAEFMTKKILEYVDIEEIKKIKIMPKQREGPEYKRQIDNLNIERFDKNFERLVISNRKVGLKIFEKRFEENVSGEEILKFAMNQLKQVI
jgi:Lhr-like helicase